jgi:gamma-glutamyltranspeptidase / glutathione hydrolase
MLRSRPVVRGLLLVLSLVVSHALVSDAAFAARRPNKPPLHGRHWMAITGKPLAATAGARMFERGGNAVDAAAAMLAATCTMWDTLSWGGETQALIYDPHTKKVVGLNALGVAPSGATPDFYRGKKLPYPPETGPLAAITPGTPGGLLVMLAEYGELSLAQVLEPAIQMADGYPIEAQLVGSIRRDRAKIEGWPASKAVFLPGGNLPEPGQIFRQPGLKHMLDRLVETEKQALAAGKSRKEAILAAYERFYRGDLGKEFAAGAQAAGALITAEDLAKWRATWEEPVSTNYRGIEVYKLTTWTQGPAMLQALNLLEPLDLKAMGYDSARYIHTLYQAMNLAFADRDFYYGDPAFPPVEPIQGLLSKDYARERWKLVDAKKNRADLGPGDPYPFQGATNPHAALLEKWLSRPEIEAKPERDANEAFRGGTTSVIAADEEGWVVSITPSGGWVPAVIAGDTGMGLSQRAQSFVLDARENPFNVIQPGQRPRVTLTPTLAMKDGAPYLAFAVQGGDTQDQNLLQFFLNIVEFGMTPQESAEAANITSYQMRSSFGLHKVEPGRLTLDTETPNWVRAELEKMGYRLDFEEKTSGPINGIWIDRAHGTFWGGSSDHGEDYGIAW